MLIPPLQKPAPHDDRSVKQCSRIAGFTLIEILVVVSLIAIFSLYMLSGKSGLTEVKLTNAAKEIASALKIARSEAMRTGIPHGVTATAVSQRVRVYELTPGALPVRTYTVRHPHSKQFIDFTVGESSGFEGVTLSSVDFTYGIGVNQNDIDFNSAGVPYFDSGATSLPLASASITLTAGADTKTITVEPTNGRVKVSP